ATKTTFDASWMSSSALTIPFPGRESTSRERKPGKEASPVENALATQTIAKRAQKWQRLPPKHGEDEDRHRDDGRRGDAVGDEPGQDVDVERDAGDQRERRCRQHPAGEVDESLGVVARLAT